MYKFSLIVLTLLLLSCQTTSENYQQIAADLNRQMEDAFKKGDLKGLAQIYSDDGYLLSPNRKATHGRKAIDEYWERFHTPINWELDVIAVSENEEDIYQSEHWKQMNQKPKHWKEESIEIGDYQVFYQLGHSKLEYESDDGVHRISHVNFIIVWKKELNGEYKIWIDTYI